MRASGPLWLVQRPPVGDPSTSCLKLHRACDELGLPIVAIDVEPGAPVELPPYVGPTIIHGRNTLMHAALAHPEYRRAVFFDPSTFTPEAYLRGWGSRMLNEGQRVVSWEEALEAVKRGPLFVRPNDDGKLFAGEVLTEAKLQALFADGQRRGLTSGRLVIAPPRELDAEARLFVVEREIISGSFYRPNTDPRLPSELLDFATEAVSTWAPREIFVLDVARVDRTYRIVEANCFNGAGFYNADLVKIVERVSAFQLARG